MRIPRACRSYVTPTLFIILASTIAVPIETTLAPLLPQIEAKIPKKFTDTVRETGSTVKYDVVRDSIALKMAGTTLQTTTVARYGLEACPLRLRCLTCGVSEAKRAAVITLQSKFTWDQDWRLRSTTTAQPAEFPDRCQVSILNIDITNQFIAPVVNDQLRSIALTIDQNAPSLTNLKPMAQQIWTALQAPVEIAPRTWLVFQPSAVALSPPRGEGLRVASTLSIDAQTRVTVGAKPQTRAVPLPALRNAEPVGTALVVPFDLHLPYAEASALANSQFARKSYKLSGGALRIDSIELAAAAKGRIRVTAIIDYNAGSMRRYDGPIVLEGVPRYDPATSMVTIPDLDYTLETKNRSVFFRAAERIAHDEIRNQLRTVAKRSLARELGEVRRQITGAINRTLAPGVTLRGRVDSVHPRMVTPQSDAMILGVELRGTASIAFLP